MVLNNLTSTGINKSAVDLIYSLITWSVPAAYFPAVLWPF